MKLIGIEGSENTRAKLPVPVFRDPQSREMVVREWERERRGNLR